MSDIERALNALNSLDAGCSRKDWIEICMATKNAGLSFEDFDRWSKTSAKYRGEKDCRSAWNSVSANGGITVNSLFYRAQQQGWVEPSKATRSNHNDSPLDIPLAEPTNPQQKPSTKAKNAYATQIWERCQPAEDTNPYIQNKQGSPEGVRVYPASEAPLIINDQDVRGWLVVPCWDGDNLQTLQFIPPDGKPKLNLNGCSFGEGYFLIGEITDLVYIGEGIGQAWAVNKATNVVVAVSFGAVRMSKVAQALRNKYPAARIILVPDVGKEVEAASIAADIDGKWVEMPAGKPSNYDANDFLKEFGADELAALLGRTKIPPFNYPLSIIFADDLPDKFSPPDEILEGFLTTGDSSVIFGASNSGKTSLALDIGCAIASGSSWMGRRTEKGLVIYVAAESPASVKRRVQGYQQHHKVKFPNLVIVQSPIDLFGGDDDTDKLIKLIRQIEKQKGQKVVLIIGDTLARMTPGANENSGQDMGKVVQRIDRIRTECTAHFMLVHHSGKNAAAGSRGWSGIRGAIDTEIEVTESADGRCCEITKQRDLSTKSLRIGFSLVSISHGTTKWGAAATSCVVMPNNVPKKQSAKRVSKVVSSILDFLNTRKSSISKIDLIKQFDGEFSSSTGYREIKKLVSSGQLKDALGIISLVV